MHWLAQGLRKVQGEPGILWQHRILKEISFSNLYHFSSVTESYPTLCVPWTAACQASLSITNS